MWNIAVNTETNRVMWYCGVYGVEIVILNIMQPLSLFAIVFSDQIKVYNILVSSVNWNKSKQYLISVFFYFFLVSTFSNVWPLPVHFLIETNNKTISLLQKLFRPSGTWISLTKTNYTIKLIINFCIDYTYIFISIFTDLSNDS